MKKLCVVLCLLLAGTAGADGLLQNTTPAERMRGASWADHFRSQASVEDCNATVTGSPTFDLDGGVTLDGSSDYLTYNLMGTEFNNDPISIVVEFTPDFAYDEDAIRYLIDTTAGARYLVLKANTASSHVLQIHLGDTQVAQIPSATYGSYWLQNQRNVLVISGTTGDTDAWLNGTAVLTSNATAWAADPPTELHIGSHNAGVQRFDGTIHSVRIFKAKLTAAEALDYYDHSTYKYMESATAVYQMRAEDHDPTNNYTLDSSGNAKHLTDTHDPVKMVTHGYDYDGTNDYHSRADSDFNPAGDFSALFVGTGEISAAWEVFVSKWNTVGDDRGWTVQHDNAGDWEFGISKDGTAGTASFCSLSNDYQVGRTSFAVITYDYIADNTSIMRLYANDGLSIVTNARGPINPASNDLVVGANGALGSKVNGDIRQVSFFDGVVLTPLQIEDAKMTAWKGLNRQ